MIAWVVWVIFLLIMLVLICSVPAKLVMLIKGNRRWRKWWE